ncbi:MAG: hypothetical protein OXG85_02410 [Chloroflexi bacterium]|nr:hypothetical protein [Chloroflexota bacterium]
MSFQYFGLQKPVFARNGWEIPQPNPLVLEKYQQTEDLVRIQTVALVDEMLGKGKTGLQIRSVSSHLYDCVGMIFANRRAWIDIEYVGQILINDGYQPAAKDDLVVGDVVVYTLGSKRVHVGLVTRVLPKLGKISNTRVLSKWGKHGEVEHRMEDVPYYLGKPCEYWSERAPHDIERLFQSD